MAIEGFKWNTLKGYQDQGFPFIYFILINISIFTYLYVYHIYYGLPHTVQLGYRFREDVYNTYNSFTYLD